MTPIETTQLEDLVVDEDTKDELFGEMTSLLFLACCVEENEEQCLIDMYVQRYYGHSSNVVRDFCREILDFGETVEMQEEVYDFCDSVKQTLLLVPRVGGNNRTIPNTIVESILPFILTRISKFTGNRTLNQLETTTQYDAFFVPEYDSE